MNKKLFSILFTLFLIGVLSVSCSNKDKTSQPTGIDSKYADKWLISVTGAGDQGIDNTILTINADGSITDDTGNNIPASQITKNSNNSYTAITTLSENGSTNKITINIEFTTETSANLKIDIVITYSDNTTNELNYSGTLTRQ